MALYNQIDYDLTPKPSSDIGALDIKQTEDLLKVRVPCPCSRSDHKSIQAQCAQFLRSENLYEGLDEAARREHVLGSLDKIVKEWVRGVLVAQGYDRSRVQEHTYDQVWIPP